MALFDVSEILDDPEFADRCVLVKRYTETVNGRRLAKSDCKEIVAVVQPASHRDIEMLSAQVGAGFMTETLSIWTREPLTVACDERLGDLIDFKGQRYSIASVEDFFANGRYFHAIAQRFGDV